MENSTLMTVLLIISGSCMLLACILIPVMRQALSDRRRTAVNEDKYGGGPSVRTAESDRRSPAEKATRRLIGDEAYERMHARVSELISHHRKDAAADIWLAAAPDDETGRHRLHTLLPGMPLSLKDVSDGGISAVEVYSDDICVGRLLLTEAEKALAITSGYRVTGTYVAEQNAYGDSDELSLKIVMFYRQSAVSDDAADEETVVPTPEKTDNSLPALSRALDSEYKHIVRGGHPMVFYQN